MTIYDGLMRQVQTQSEAHGPGRIVTDTTYDDHGLVDEQTGAYLAKDEPAAELFEPRSKSLMPSWVKYRYDGLERQVRQSTYHDGDYVYASSTTYGDTSTYMNPAGSTTPRTRTYSDALGRVTSIRHYKDVGSTDQGRTTAYEYDARGNRSKVIDPAGNAWTYTYDARGRVTSATDPDTGTTETRYDDADRPVKVTDAKSRTTYTQYDALGRVTYVREGSETATPVKEFTYDTLPSALGQPVASIRHTPNGDYINRVTGYDTDYRPTGSETVIPANTMTKGFSGTYAYGYTYTPTGKPQTVTLPSIGGLAREKVVTRYNGDGLAESTSGLAWYTADVTYSPYGEPLRTVSGAQPYRVWTTNFVDPHTGRLQRTVADRETSGPHRITDSYYSYDKSGTITSNARKLSEASGSTWDTQCFTYDAMGELTNAWTSNITPGGKGTGCKSSNGTTWGYRTDYAASSGPVADAPDASTDASSPDTSLTSTLAATAPEATTVSTGTTAYHQSFTFDWLGNRATMTEHNPADATKNVTFTYGYDATQPHTMKWISSNPSGKESSYGYDAVGNTESRDLPDTTQDLTWTSENKLATITDDGKKTTYVYDADGNRILENSSSGSTLYLGETEVTTNGSGTITRASRSYTQSGAPTVTRTTSNGATTGHQRSVMLADHLGTVNTTVQVSSGQEVTRRAFKPYGEARGPKPSTWPNKRSYLGVGIDDTATGLTHIGAREYDQNAGRFLSADPIIDIADPLQMNGYAYSNNSPVSKSDPTGLCPADMCSDGGQNTNETPLRPGGGGVTKGGSTGGAGNSSSAGTGTGNGTGLRPIDPVSGLPLLDLGDQRGKARLNRPPVMNPVAAEVALTGCSWLPVIGWGCDAYDLRRAVKQDDGWGVVAGLVGFLPAGDILKTFRKTRKVADEIKGAKKPSCKCFLAGTDVLMADGTTKHIEDVELGDEVLATDPKTGESGPRRVTRLIVTEDDKHFNELSIATEDGIKKLTATHEHPFWSPSERDWIEAGKLKPGMTLRTDDGDTVIVTGNRAFTKRARTYNLTVDDLHTYYVLAGATPVLVHNSDCDLPDGYTSSPALKGDPYHPDSVAERSRQNRELYAGTVADQAAALGYKTRIPPQKVRGMFDSHGQAVFSNGKNYITRDVDGHNVTDGWKMFNRRGQRIGTYDPDLNYLKE